MMSNYVKAETRTNLYIVYTNNKKWECQFNLTLINIKTAQQLISIKNNNLTIKKFRKENNLNK